MQSKPLRLLTIYELFLKLNQKKVYKLKLLIFTTLIKHFDFNNADCWTTSTDTAEPHLLIPLNHIYWYRWTTSTYTAEPHLLIPLNHIYWYLCTPHLLIPLNHIYWYLWTTTTDTAEPQLLIQLNHIYWYRWTSNHIY